MLVRRVDNPMRWREADKDPARYIEKPGGRSQVCEYGRPTAAALPGQGQEGDARGLRNPVPLLSEPVHGPLCRMAAGVRRARRRDVPRARGRRWQEAVSEGVLEDRYE